MSKKISNGGWARSCAVSAFGLPLLYIDPPYQNISPVAHCCCKPAASVLQLVVASLLQVYFLYANFSSGTYFAATLRHIPSAYFCHTVCNNISMQHTLCIDSA